MLSAIAGALVLVAAAAPAQDDPPRSGGDRAQIYKRARVSYDKAAKQFAKKDYAGARKTLGESIAQLPEYSDAHLLVAKSAYMLKDYASALDAIARAEKTFDEFAGLGLDLASARLEALRRQRGSASGAVGELQAALQRADSPEERQKVQVYLNEAEQRLRDLDRQLSEPVTPGAAGMPAEYPFVHGNILLRLNRLAEAESQYKRALEIQPRYPEAVNNLASLYYAAGRAQQALDVIQAGEAQGVTVNPELKKAVLDALE